MGILSNWIWLKQLEFTKRLGAGKSEDKGFCFQIDSTLAHPPLGWQYSECGVCGLSSGLVFPVWYLCSMRKLSKCDHSRRTREKDAWSFLTLLWMEVIINSAILCYLELHSLVQIQGERPSTWLLKGRMPKNFMTFLKPVIYRVKITGTDFCDFKN